MPKIPTRVKKVHKILKVLDNIDKLSDADFDEGEFLDITINHFCQRKHNLRNDESDANSEKSAWSSEVSIRPVPNIKQIKDAKNPMELLSAEEFEKQYRFSKDTVYDILQMISYGLTKHTNRGHPFPPTIQLLITLRFLATGSFQSKTDNHISQPTISRIIKKVTTLLSELKLRFIKIPEKNDLKTIQTKFFERGQFPDVSGCVGSTHVPIKCPGKAMADGYLNENGFYSFRVLVHGLMLKDEPRMKAYQNAIKLCQNAFVGKIVLDVGAGTGILSVFAAQAGAKKVFAVEASNIANIAKDVVKENGFENTIEVVQTKIEHFKLPVGYDAVDIIISEWMGMYLLHEGMLDSVIYARDHFLKSDGLMFPASATISLAPCSVPCQFDNWANVNGVQMNSVGKAIRQQKSTKPGIISIEKENLLHCGTVVTWLDLRDVTTDDLKEISFKEVIVCDKTGRYQGICLWFDCEFPFDDGGASVVLSTSPFSQATHWKQTVILLPENAHQDVEPKYPLAFSLQILRSTDDQRRYNIELELLDADEMEHSIPCDCYLTKCILTKAHLNSLQLDTEMKG